MLIYIVFNEHTFAILLPPSEFRVMRNYVRTGAESTGDAVSRIQTGLMCRFIGGFGGFGEV